MIIRFFKTNNVLAVILLPFFAIAIWSFAILSPEVLPTKHTMPLFEMCGNFLNSVKWLSTLIAMMLVVGQAFLLNYIINENEVLKKQSYLPALFYLLFLSNNSSMLMLHPLLFANLFLLFALNKLMSSYRKDVAFSQAFDAGLLLSLASLFYFPYVLLFPVLGIAFILFRPFVWREWFISFLGVLVPYAFVITYYFWNGTLDYLWYDKMFFPFLREKPSLDMPDSFYYMIGIGWIVIFLSFFTMFGSLSGGSQRSKKGLILFIWLFFMSIPVMLIAPEISTKYFSVFAVPTAVFCANYFLNMKKELIGEILFLLLIASLFVNLISHYF
ncbi:MAG: hypothetical protein JNL69_12845 [Bacteroidia bacterium]|nr:hypothetical protein [Bacteroidia bacterium]